MLRRIVWSVILVITGGSLAALVTHQYLPGIGTKMEAWLADRVGWTEEARQADPAGYVAHVIGRLQRDLTELTRVRRELLGQIAELSHTLRQQEAMLAQAEQLAEEFREHYRRAAATNGFPVTVRGGLYSADQVKAQVSLLLAEAQGYRAAAERLRKVRQEAELRLETVTVQINRTEAELVALEAQRQIFLARQIADQQQALLTKIDELSQENQKLLVANSVRTVRELMEAERPASPIQIREELITAFLAEADGNGQLPGQQQPQDSPQTAPAAGTPVEASAAAGSGPQVSSSQENPVPESPPAQAEESSPAPEVLLTEEPAAPAEDQSQPQPQEAETAPNPSTAEVTSEVAPQISPPDAGEEAPQLPSGFEDDGSKDKPETAAPAPETPEATVPEGTPESATSVGAQEMPASPVPQTGPNRQQRLAQRVRRPARGSDVPRSTQRVVASPAVFTERASEQPRQVLTGDTVGGSSRAPSKSKVVQAQF
jgi:hypothetical protein